MRIHLFVFWQFTLLALPVFAQATNDTWTDQSPHKEAFVRVNGTSLEYLDWGGSGIPLLFLAGLGNTAHIFDDMAPKLTNHFHVLGLTRRGYGKSDRPETGYDTGTLVEDIHQFLDALKIKRVILVGHSFAGMELSRFAVLYPDRVDKLVYLDCAYSYDQPGTMEVLSQVDSLTPHPSTTDRANFSSLRQWFKNNRPGWNDACESDFRNTRVFTTSGGHSGQGSTPDVVEDTLVKGFMEFHPEYVKLTAPVLAFYADHQLEKLVAQADDASRKKAAEIAKSGRDWQRNQIERFKQEVKNSQIVELPDTDHFCFIQRQDEVVRQMQSFLNKQH